MLKIVMELTDVIFRPLTDCHPSILQHNTELHGSPHARNIWLNYWNATKTRINKLSDTFLRHSEIALESLSTWYRDSGCTAP